MILVVDTETTGIPARGEIISSPSYPHIVEIAGLLVDPTNEKELSSFSFVVRPDGWDIPKEATDAHGITNELAAMVGVPLVIAVASYTNLRATADEVVGHNVAFDLGMIAAALHRLNRTPLSAGKPYATVCTAELGTPVAKLPATERMIAAGYGGNFKKPTLTELHQALFGEPFEGAHGALADCRATLRCLLEMRRRG